MKILVLDNYDSFTYNLVHAIESISGEKVEVHRNDKITLDEINRFDKIVLSPGPGIPEILARVVTALADALAHQLCSIPTEQYLRGRIDELHHAIERGDDHGVRHNADKVLKLMVRLIRVRSPNDVDDIARQ